MATEPGIVIRPMRERDLPAVRAVWDAAGLPSRPAGRDAEAALRAQLARFADTYLVAEADGGVVGVVLGTHDERKGWINRLAVAPAYQRRGIAARLVAACELALTARGIGIVAALVEEGNGGSAALFRALGYATDVPVHYFRKTAWREV